MDTFKSFKEPAPQKKAGEAPNVTSETNKNGSGGIKAEKSSSVGEASTKERSAIVPKMGEDKINPDSVATQSKAGDEKDEKANQKDGEKPDGEVMVVDESSKRPNVSVAKRGTAANKGDAEKGEGGISEAKESVRVDTEDLKRGKDKDLKDKEVLTKTGDATTEKKNDSKTGGAPQGDENGCNGIADSKGSNRSVDLEKNDENTVRGSKDANNHETPTRGASDVKVAVLIDIEDEGGDSHRSNSKIKRRAAKSILTDAAASPSTKRAKTENRKKTRSGPGKGKPKTVSAKKDKPKTAPGEHATDDMVYEGVPTRPIKDGGWPKGWIERQYQRKEGKTKGRVDYYFYPPGKNDHKLRSIAEVQRYIKEFNATKSHEKAWEARK